MFPLLLPMSLQQNQDRKHRTYVYVLTVTETLEAWEDSVNIGTQRQYLQMQHATGREVGHPIY